MADNDRIEQAAQFLLEGHKTRSKYLRTFHSSCKSSYSYLELLAINGSSL